MNSSQAKVILAAGVVVFLIAAFQFNAHRAKLEDPSFNAEVAVKKLDDRVKILEQLQVDIETKLVPTVSILTTFHVEDFNRFIAEQEKLKQEQEKTNKEVK